MSEPTEDKAVEALKKEMRVWCNTPFFVNVGTDDGGRHLQVWIEREEPSQRLEPWIHEMLPSGKYMGWRLIVIKCPPDHIELQITQKKQKGW